MPSVQLGWSQSPNREQTRGQNLARLSHVRLNLFAQIREAMFGKTIARRDRTEANRASKRVLTCEPRHEPTRGRRKRETQCTRPPIADPAVAPQVVQVGVEQIQ